MVGTRRDDDATETPSWRAGLLVGLGTLMLVAIPAGAALVLAAISFTGCLLECTEPEPAVGTGWAVVALGFLALPVVLGLRAARSSVRPAWPWIVGIAALAGIGIIYAQRVL